VPLTAGKTVLDCGKKVIVIATLGVYVQRVFAPTVKTRMVCVRTIRCLRAYLLALFVIAQVAGVVPLMYDHTLNVFETTPVAGHSHIHIGNGIVASDSDHHHGVLDLHDQCCALHTLAGPLPQIADAVPAEFAGIRMTPVATIALSDGAPFLIDRPPRPLPQI
jgi:hypothetical protein